MKANFIQMLIQLTYKHIKTAQEGKLLSHVRFLFVKNKTYAETISVIYACD